VATADDVKRIALSLPGAEEHPSYGGLPAYRVGKKNFAYIRDDRNVVTLDVSDLDEKEALLASDDGSKFFTTPHHDGYPTVLVRLSAVDGDELTELITDAWRLKAPKRVAATYDG
jgi:hypothetical protein